MPMPWTYRHASKEWRAILDDLKDRMDLVSDNSAYTALDGVLQAFRRRLTAQQGLDFASVLPAIPRAIFVADWKPDEKPVPFADRRTMTREAQQLRPHHNLTPDNAIEAVAWTIRRYVNKADFQRVLECLPPGAVQFWHVDVADPREIGPRIF
ncbi:DUF2267 domain-containing protein [Paracoccus sp. P2]|uniref:DUF2267 domain-containing protein n=1 Tax=Paracoccus pantotrophus TaxID=82367 RepID=A0A7H9BTH6_PARPN|nr:DUF2267 domain-containing protein [Paracoccus pantotrophus]MDF3853414.1 DUF2267 domain-containing protein [Paracoccus pantotrophus]QLH14700.1 DUF2267 domain-containing protein [Paracoccus pantotrophus]RDD98815.1 DUF2267 domain-containing protein [Paracoccus pantotrophus]RNI18896.1 DUF2267 domain-containing protein [Paracoccus pantotrophus]WGR64827.1 DUF2267 domain-containing protein [Paracoccus pantotrophus]